MYHIFFASFLVFVFIHHVPRSHYIYYSYLAVTSSTGIKNGYVRHHQPFSVSSQDLQHIILITNETPVRVCLADFGLSTLTPSIPGETATITAGGTPVYMAPELLCPQSLANQAIG
jgi:serine/threonine protein kinase